MAASRTIASLIGALLLTGAGSRVEAPLVQTSVASGTYSIEGSLETLATPAVAWAVLSDYGHICDFVSSIRTSTVRSRHNDEAVVEQEAIGQLFVFSRRVTVLLKIQEEPGRSIVFHDILRRDFESYDGAWSIAPSSHGSRISYRLRARPKMGLPAFLGTSMFTRQISDLLGEVRDEMERRAARPSH